MEKRGHTDEELIAGLRSNDENIVDETFYYLYSTYYQMAVSIIKNNSGNESEAEDVFQDSLIALYENIRNDKFRRESSIKTYLFAMIRNNWFTRLRKSRDVIAIDDPDEKFSDNLEGYDNNTDKDLHDLLDKIMEKIGESCREVLRYYYYEQMSMKDIAERMDFVNVKSTKSKKYKCLKKLIELINSNPRLKEQLLESI